MDTTRGTVVLTTDRGKRSSRRQGVDEGSMEVAGIKGYMGLIHLSWGTISQRLYHINKRKMIKNGEQDNRETI